MNENFPGLPDDNTTTRAISSHDRRRQFNGHF